jgi:5-methyltetrahydrofolate--homocysteine methyltransferase
MTKLTSPNGDLYIGPSYPTILINDQLRIMDQSQEIFEQLASNNFDGFLELARWGHQVGTDMVDILVTHSDLDEVSLLPAIARAVRDEIGCPIALDSRDPDALEAALQALQPDKVLINSVTAEPASLEALLPLAKKYHAAIVGMPIGEKFGLPKTVEGRVAEGRVILEAAESIGISREDVVLDAICLASSAEPGSFQVTLQTLRAFHEQLGIATTLGIGNAGHGMPEQTVIDLAYLVAAVPWGLDSALVNPATRGLVETVRAVDFLSERDAWGKRYIKNYRNKKKDAKI